MKSNRPASGPAKDAPKLKQSLSVPLRRGRRPFGLGTVYATPAVLAHLTAHGRLPAELLGFHQGCCWGDLDEEDRKANDAALKTGARLLSSYTVEEKIIYVITEAQGPHGVRASTTLLFADEY